MSSTSPQWIAVGLRRSSRIAAPCRSMCGAPRSSLPPLMAAGPPRSCAGLAKPVVWRWQARFMEQGVDGLLRDKTRKPGKPPLPAATVQKVVALVTGPPPGETTHWTGRMLAKAVGISLRSVQRILEAHHLAPHRIRTFKLSNDPKFADKLRDVVGLYVDPPAHAVVLSV